jgi:hypothetical protein
MNSSRKSTGNSQETILQARCNYSRPGIDMEILDLMQWPAMIVTVIAAWLIGSLKKRRREIGFWFFLFSNILWIIWGWHANAYALIVLQIALATLNIRGVLKNDPANSAK